jgi:nucleotide-binding universal stress UspA family protein
MATIPVSKRIALKNVLFLTDFSEASTRALPFAAMIASSYGAKVTALHVLVPPADIAYMYMTPEISAALLDTQDDVAQTEMGRVEASLVGMPRETIVERDVSVWAVLSKTLQEREIDLIVLGTHGRTGLKKAVFGSTAEEIFRRTRVPVLTIGPAVRTGAHGGGRFHGVLLATDFNPVSNIAASYAVSLAQENQSQLILLHVLPTPKPGKGNKPTEISVAEALHRLENLISSDAELWCRPEAVVEHGEPGAQILATARRCGADLIVLGVRGMETLTEVVTRVERATAYEVVAHAACPVLTVRG